jgi:hypothetical protein
MKTHVEFRSDQFPPYEGEEDEINPGRHGKRLAEFLVNGLREKGFDAKDPIPEDWGWVVPIKRFRLWIGCGNYEEYPDGYLCFIQCNLAKIQKLLATIRKLLGGVDVVAPAVALQEAMDQLLSANPSVRNKKWWTSDEFNRPRTLIKS